jgi:hypothetical protein
VPQGPKESKKGAARTHGHECGRKPTQSEPGTEGSEEFCITRPDCVEPKQDQANQQCRPEAQCGLDPTLRADHRRKANSGEGTSYGQPVGNAPGTKIEHSGRQRQTQE